MATRLVSPHDREALTGLKRAFRLLTAAGLSLLLIGSLMMGQLVGPVPAIKWLLGAVLVLSYLLYRLRLGLSDNRRPQSDRLLPGLGGGTLLTVARGAAISMLAGFAFLKPLSALALPGLLIWVPGILYILASFADFGDGYLARRSDHVTCLGETLDMQTDALGLLAASLAAIAMGRLPGVYLAVGLAYYLFHAGLAYRRLKGRTVHPLHLRPNARMMAGFQMGFVGVALLPIFSPRVLAPAAFIFMVPLLLGFIRDWMQVSDRLQRREKILQLCAHWLTVVLPLLLRVLLLLMLIHIASHLQRMENSGWDLMLCLFFVLPVIGWMGRSASLALSLMLAYRLSFEVPRTELAIAFLGATALMLSGTGAFSIWKPEDRWLTGKAGQPPVLKSDGLPKTAGNPDS
jgi:CDP-diacylglycerol--glycerol-3-phosphate 3-phosphatidyltransferase